MQQWNCDYEKCFVHDNRWEQSISEDRNNKFAAECSDNGCKRLKSSRDAELCVRSACYEKSRIQMIDNLKRRPKFKLSTKNLRKNFTCMKKTLKIRGKSKFRLFSLKFFGINLTAKESRLETPRPCFLMKLQTFLFACLIIYQFLFLMHSQIDKGEGDKKNVAGTSKMTQSENVLANIFARHRW